MAPNPNWPSQALTRWRYSLVALALLLILVLGWRGREPISLARPDEFVYLALSQSLEAGSYRDIYLDGAPLHVKYPPGYPAWIVAVRKLIGDDHDILRGANLALLAIFTLCLYGIVRSLAGIPLALATTLLVALNPTLLETGGTLLSETLFLALVGGSLLCAVRAGPQDGRSAAGAMGFAIAAALTRTVGIALLLALGIWLWQRRRPREMIGFAVGTLLMVGGWLVYAATAPVTASGGSYRGDIATGLATSEAGIAARWAASFWRKTTLYLSDGLPWSLRLPTIPGTLLDNIAWLATMLVLLAAGLLVFWRKSRPIFGYLAFTGLLIALWPWRVDRLLVPLLPFIIAAMLIGMQSLTARLAPRWRLPMRAGLLMLMGFGAARTALARDSRMSRCNREDPFRTAGCYARLAPTLASASEYLRVHAPEGSVILTLSPPEIHYLSGHLTAPAQLVEGLRNREAGRLLRSRKIQYVLIPEERGYSRRELAPALLGSCDEFRVQTRFATGGFLLFMGPARTPAENACEALTHLVRPLPPGSLEY